MFPPPQFFAPPPGVDSAVVRMLPLSQPPLLDVALLSELVQVAFSQRRKLLRHTLGRWLADKGFGGHFDVPVSYTHLRAHETVLDLVCRLLLEKKKKKIKQH